MFPDHPSRVAVVGDWHGTFEFAETVIRAVADAGADVIMHVGDFGFHTHGKDTARHLQTVESACGERGIPLFWVDGNRDNHDRLSEIMVDPFSGLRAISPHIAHLPRGFRWTWHGKTWMALGGAYSPNRRPETEGQRWWVREVLSEDDAARAVRGGHVDVLIAHDCPDGTGILEGMGNSHIDAGHLAAAGEHRAVLGSVVDAVQPALMFHGHYHRRLDSLRPLASGGLTQVSGLSSDREGLAGNWVVLDAVTNRVVVDSARTVVAA